MADHKVTYQFNFTGNLGQGLLNVTGSATKATSAVSNLHKKISALSNIGFVATHAIRAFKALNGAIKGAQQAYNAQMVAERQLEQVMRNTMNATDDEIQSIKDLASEQQKLGVIGTEVQLAGAKELGTYVTKTDILKKLIPVMNDMLTHQYGLNASQEQAAQMAQMVGKVLDGQTGALSRAGYRFDEAQEKILKFGSEEQRVALLSKIVTQYMGGMNAALANTPEGKLKQHANNMGALKARIGGLVVAVKTALLPMQQNVAATIEKIVAFFEANRTRLMEIVGTVARVAQAAFGAVTTVLKGLCKAISATWPLLLAVASAIALNNLYTRISNGLRFIATITSKMLYAAQTLETGARKKNTIAIRANSIALRANAISANVAALSAIVFAGAVKVATWAVKGLSKAIYAIPIVGWIAAAIAAIIALFKLLWDRSRKFREILFGVWAAARAVFHNIGVVVKRLWDNFLKPIFTLWWGVAKFVYGGIWNGIKSVFTNIVGAAKRLWATLTDGFVRLKETITGAFTAALGWLKSGGGAIGSFVYKWIVDPVSKAFSSLWDFVKRIFTWIGGKLSKIFAPLAALWKKIFSKEDMQDVSAAYAEGAKAGGEHFDNSKAGDESAFALPTASDMGKGGVKLPTPDDAANSAVGIAEAGGKSVRNVSLTIGKLVENITISVTNLKESKEQIKAQVAEALLTAVNDVNLAA